MSSASSEQVAPSPSPRVVANPGSHRPRRSFWRCACGRPGFEQDISAKTGCVSNSVNVAAQGGRSSLKTTHPGRCTARGKTVTIHVACGGCAKRHLGPCTVPSGIIGAPCTVLVTATRMHNIRRRSRRNKFQDPKRGQRQVAASQAKARKVQQGPWNE
jgi:hypothetical protein